ncbi:FAD-dependent monooxygenase [Streptomyces prasinus]|uniref:FAD-dependent monooxygenase n=1 Tax=Streptomyces prasinus TaxID=67345 RepID=UPI0006E41593
MRARVHVRVPAQVVVVGGGPVGMSLAGAPAGYGAGALAVETGAAVSERPRATTPHARVVWCRARRGHLDGPVRAGGSRAGALRPGWHPTPRGGTVVQDVPGGTLRLRTVDCSGPHRARHRPLALEELRREVGRTAGRGIVVKGLAPAPPAHFGEGGVPAPGGGLSGAGRVRLVG